MLFNNYKYGVVLFGFFNFTVVIVDALRIGIAPYGAKMCGMGFSTNIRPRWGHDLQMGYCTEEKIAGQGISFSRVQF